jgi:hypothetical protein
VLECLKVYGKKAEIEYPVIFRREVISISGLGDGLIGLSCGNKAMLNAERCQAEPLYDWDEGNHIGVYNFYYASVSVRVHVSKRFL